MRQVTQDELAAGDVLLYRSDTWIARAIRHFDGSEVSHAGLYLGGGMVGEALAEAGLVRTPLNESVDDCDWVAVRRLRTVPDTVQPVLDRANWRLDQGNRYAYGQVLLLAMVCSTRKLNLSNPLVRRIVYSAINQAAALVRRLQSGAKQPMICSEFVYRSFDEAVLPDEDDAYTIEIEPQWSAGARACALGRRRRAANDAASGYVDPDSLLGQLAREAGDLGATIGTTETLSAGLREVSDEELDAMIGAYLTGEASAMPKTASEATVGPELTMRDLQDALGALAISLHGATDAGRKLEMDTLGAPDGHRSASPVETMLEISADFVTPGDLLRSASLATIGALQLGQD